MLILKIIFLFLAVFFTVVNASRLYGKQNTPPINFIAQAIGITGFIVIQWLL